MGLLKVTSISEVSDILLLSISRGDESICIAGVDDRAVATVPANRGICMEYPRHGSNIIQIYDARPHEGTNFALLEKDRSSHGYLLSFWHFQ